MTTEPTLRPMRGRLLLLLLLAAAPLLLPAQLLWKISGRGLAAPSYLMGTMHTVPDTFALAIPGFEAAFAEARTLVGEIDLQEATAPDGIRRQQQAVLLPEGQRLTGLLTPGETARLDSLLRQLLGTGLDNPLAAGLDRLRPAALTAQLTLAAYARNHPGFGSRLLLDAYLQHLARQAGKPVKALETLEFQLDLLYTGLPLERQARDLMCFVDHYDFHEAQLEKMHEAYMARRLDRLARAADEKMRNACDPGPDDEQRLVTGRNRAWAGLLPALMADGPVLVAVGCLHLTGQEGLIALLRRAGYTVEPAA